MFQITYSSEVREEAKELFGEKDIYGLALIGSIELATAVEDIISYYDNLSIEDAIHEAIVRDPAAVLGKIKRLKELLPKICSEISEQLSQDKLLTLLRAVKSSP